MSDMALLLIDLVELFAIAILHPRHAHQLLLMFQCYEDTTQDTLFALGEM